MEYMYNEKLHPIIPQNKEVVEIATEPVAEWANGYALSVADKHYNTGTKYRPLPLTVRWTAVGADSYLFHLSTVESMQNPVEHKADTNEVVLEALFTCTTYYWQVDAVFGERVERSAVFSFSTPDVPRTIDLGPVSNTRDIGGVRLASGGRLRQGLVYRGGRVDDMTAEWNIREQRLFGIKTEIDLQRPEDVGQRRQSPLGDQVRYVNISCPCYFGDGVVTGIHTPEGSAGIREVFRLLACEDVYPVYIHCHAGRDRTGTLLMLLEGVLGALEEDIHRDYELSLFAAAHVPDPVGDCWLPTYRWVAAYGEGESFAEHAQNYLLDAGVTKEELEAIRSILVS